MKKFRTMIKSNRIINPGALLLLLLFTATTPVLSQNNFPYGINYQAVVNGEDGKPLADKSLIVQVSVHSDSPTGDIVWQEGHTVTTNGYGLFSLVIGQGNSTHLGTAVSFKKIAWSTKPFYVEVQSDFGSGLKYMGTVKLQSVPYAFVADSALHAPMPRLAHLVDVNKNGLRVNMALKWDGYQWVPGDSLLTDYLFITGDLITDRNIHVNSDLYVYDSITTTTIDGIKGDFDTLEIDVNAWIKNNLDVDHNTMVHNDLKVDNNTFLKNDLYVTDSITTFTIDGIKGDFDTLEVDVNGWIKNNLDVDHNARFHNDLYVDSNVTITSDLYVTDTVKTFNMVTDWAEINTLKLNSNATIGNNLDVLNSIYVQKTTTSGDDIFAQNDVYVTDSITTFTIDGIKGDFDTLEVDVNGWIKNNLDVDHNTMVHNDLKVDNNTFLKNDLYVTDSITTFTIDGIKGDFDTLEVDVNGWIKNNLDVDHNTMVHNDLKVDNNTFLKSDLYVTDTITATTVDADNGNFNDFLLNNSMVIANDLTVLNDVYVTDTVKATSADLDFGDITDLYVNHNTNISNDLKVNNNTFLKSDLYVTDSITATTFYGLKGEVDNLLVNQNTNITNDLTVTNNTIVNGTFKLASGTTTNKISTDVSLASQSDNSLVTEKAIYTFVRVKEAELNSNLDIDSAYLYSLILNNQGDIDQDSAYTYNLLAAPHGTIEADRAAIVDGNKDMSGFRNITMTGNLTIQGNQGFSTGTTINKFSTDGTLISNSDNIVPTEKAVKTYVDFVSTQLSSNAVLRDGTQTLTANWDAGNFNITSKTFESDVAVGTSPFIVVSTTKVANLNVDLFDDKTITDFALLDGSQALTANWDAGNFNIISKTFESDVAVGTSPFTVVSTTKVANLNADLFDDKTITDFALLDGSQALTANWDAGNFNITSKTFESDVATGTAPLTVASTTKVANLNADLFDDKTLTDFMLLDGSQSMKGNLDVGNNKITSLALPTTNYDAVNKRYADSIVRVDSTWKKYGTKIYFNSDNVGINVNNPAAKLHVNNGSFLISGATGTLPVTTSQTKLFWVPSLKAFRAGTVTNTNWDNANIGSYSFSAGFNTRAKGNYTVAIGNNAVADTLAAVAFGSGQAGGAYSFAAGSSVQSTGNYSTAMGINSVASGDNSSAFGKNSTASGNSSFVSGESNTASGLYAFAMGLNTTASGNSSMSLGSSNTASGNYAITFGRNSKASKSSAVAIGDSSSASGFGALSLGFRDTASSPYAFAMGYQSKAKAKYATALGESNTAKGMASLALGSNTTAFTNYSTTLGYHTWASANYGLVGGSYNDSDYTALFIIGNGVDTNRNNALILYGNGNMTIGGTLTQNSDKRLKENIHPMESVLDKVLKIQPVYYEFKDKRTHPAGVQIGVLAQEVELQFPELVRRDSKGYLSVSYSNLSAVLIQAIREQQAMILEQKQKLEEQEANYGALLKRVEALEDK